MPKNRSKLSESFVTCWGEECEKSFQEPKTQLTQAPVLAFADSQKLYLLHVDASLDGLGGVLYQEQSDGICPVAFSI